MNVVICCYMSFIVVGGYTVCDKAEHLHRPAHTLAHAGLRPDFTQYEALY